jgi:superoxide dismutase, Cu-Zn family
MKKHLIFGTALAFLAYPAPAAAATQAIAQLNDSHGKHVGEVRFQQTETGVRIEVTASGLKPGTHGIHIHEKGSCETPDFKSAGSHFSPEVHEHGLKNPQGPHAGDLPNLKVSEDGKAKTEFESNLITLKPKEKDSLLKKGGTSLVIHAKADDQMTSPAGESGDRIACGVIRSS